MFLSYSVSYNVNWLSSFQTGCIVFFAVGVEYCFPKNWIWAYAFFVSEFFALSFLASSTIIKKILIKTIEYADIITYFL